MDEWTEEQRLRLLLDVAEGQLTRQADSLFLLERFLLGMEKHLNAGADLVRFELLSDVSAAILMTQQLLRDTDAAKKGMLLRAQDLSRIFIH